MSKICSSLQSNIEQNTPEMQSDQGKQCMLDILAGGGGGGGGGGGKG